MRNSALAICCASCVLGAFGVFCRWLQNMTAFEESTGLYISGNFWGKALIFICAAAFFVLYGMTFRLRRSKSLVSPEGYRKAMHGSTPLHKPFYIVIGLLMIAGSALVLLKSDEGQYPDMLRILALLGCLAAAGFMAMSAGSMHPMKPATLCLASVMPIALYGFWLILSYRQDASTSVVWSYAIEILALVCSLLASYYVAGFAFDRQQTYKAVFFCTYAAFLCIVTLSDERSTSMQVMFAVSACMMLFQAWMIVSNLVPYEPPKVAPEFRREADDAAKRSGEIPGDNIADSALDDAVPGEDLSGDVEIPGFVDAGDGDEPEEDDGGAMPPHETVVDEDGNRWREWIMKEKGPKK